MSSQKTLQQQIDDLTKEHQLKEMAAQSLGTIKYLAFLTGHDNEISRLAVTAIDFAEIGIVFSKFPPTNISTEIGNATKSETVLNTPFRIDIDNPAAPSKYNVFTESN